MPITKMAAIFSAVKIISQHTGLPFRLWRMVLRICFLGSLSLAPLSLFAQGGPPLLTDDPGTPGKNNWEINLGYTMDRQWAITITDAHSRHELRLGATGSA